MKLDNHEYRKLIYNKKKKKKYRWKSVFCTVSDIIHLMKESSQVGVQLVVEYNGERYKIGVGAAYDFNIGFYDFVFHIDDQGFETLDEFINEAFLGDILFMSINQKIELLEYDEGNPRNSTYIRNNYKD